MARPWTLGIDLGTTNSTAVVFDGETLEPVRTASGSPLLPSVVRITKTGQVVVGDKARKYLERDPDNTRGGFKRLLGTDTAISFPAAGRTLAPRDLSAEVLRTLIADVIATGRAAPTAAVVTVPALFELPQTEDTARAARAAGLIGVEMLQEPVASALAGGFKGDGDGCWLVYDLGGGTFDASLVVGEEGLLSVIGHDGDNYLGGRDLDALTATLIAEALAARGQPLIDAKNPAHQLAWRTLLALAEDAKIELSRCEQASITADDALDLDGDVVEIDVTISRAALEERALPLIERSIDVCRRLLLAHGRDNLDRVVLVGGPTAMPLLRTRVAEALGPLAPASLDPMTLVAQGAALFAAQRGLWCGVAEDPRAAAKRATTPTSAPHPMTSAVDGSEAARSGRDGPRALSVKAPPVSTDLLPFVVGSVVDPNLRPRLARIRLVRAAGSTPGVEAPAWVSAWEDVDSEGTFTIGAELLPRRGNMFTIEAMDETEAPIETHPATLSILQGVTIGDPPVSRSIGVAMANGHVHVYLEKGLPLPARRSFVHKTVDTILPNQAGTILRIPLVQGEYTEARFCRLIGALEIKGQEVTRLLPAGSAVELTLALDRGGRMTAHAVIPALGKSFEQVASLVVPEASVEVLQGEVARILERLGLLHAQAAADETPLVQRLALELDELERLIERAAGGDVEAGQRARRAAIDLEAQIAELEARRSWPQLVEDAMDDATWASEWVERLGTVAEKRMLQSVLEALERSKRLRSVRELERQRRSLRRIGHVAFLRHETAFIQLFESCASRVDEASDLKEASRLVERGRKLADAGENDKLEPIVARLHELLPVRAEVRRQAHESGVR